jgi:CRP/FNR family transcriptional regulator, cyclic AMP receptor protein
MLDAAVLRTVAIFGGLSEAEQVLVQGLLEERRYEAGAVVVEEGTPGRELFVIRDGRAAVVKRGPDGRGITVAEFGPGACFGEMALVGIIRRSASVQALSSLHTLVLPYARVGPLAEEHPKTFTLLVLNLAREVCRRLQQADALLGEFGIGGPRPPC